VTASLPSGVESVPAASGVGRLALFLPSLRGGGAERVMVDLARGLLARGYPVDVVLPQVEGPYLDLVPPEVRVVDLRAGRVLASLPALVRYLRREQPAALLATLSHANVIALWARRIAGVPTRVVVREANTLSVASRDGARLGDRLLPWLARRFYGWADEIVAVSDGVARDLAAAAGLPPERVHVLHSPLATPELRVLAAEPVDHPWFGPGQPPVVLGVGRLAKQKDFATLLRAFAAVRSSRVARLAILGEGEERPALESLARELDIGADLWLPGYQRNPFKFMARAGIFVLSSLYEGSPGALVQALACGAPVVATDCPSGPREILGRAGAGDAGHLVPVGDSAAMAAAIEITLTQPRRPIPAEVLAPFTLEVAVERYLGLLRAGTHA
jgi:glycosyltransferase involved in cell wall biosynthesis